MACAYKRAADVMVAAARNLPRAEIEGRSSELIDWDEYGMRAGLATVLGSAGGRSAANRNADPMYRQA